LDESHVVGCGGVQLGLRSDGYSREVIEHALAHQLKEKAEAANARGSLFDKRRQLMADWAMYCVKVASTASVSPIRGETVA